MDKAIPPPSAVGHDEHNEAVLDQIARLGPNACLGDLPAHDFTVEATTLGRFVADEFSRRSYLPAVIVTQADGSCQLLSQQVFYKQLSKPFAIEIYLRRPIQILLEAAEMPTLALPADSPIAVVARHALERPTTCVYEPLLVHGCEGPRSLDIHVLFLAQTHLLQVAQAALVQSEKLASLGQLAAGMAHEINNPLAFALNNLQVLHRDLGAAMAILTDYRRGREALEKLSPELAAEVACQEQECDLDYTLEHFHPLFEKAEAGLRRVRDIVQNLRTFVRLDGADFSEVDLNASLLSALEILGHEVKKKAITIAPELGELPPVMGHPRQLNQVLLNLLLNAVQSCADTWGRISVRTRQDGGAALVEIEDNGCGIEPAHLPRIFDPFFTTKPVGQGTGLGLSVSYGIVRDHRGSIVVDSRPGRGSVFRVRLPLSPAGR
jgi:signal transduction histidine kinase